MWVDTQKILIGGGLKISRQGAMVEPQGMNIDNEEPRGIKKMAMVTMRQKEERSTTTGMTAETLENIRQRGNEERVQKVPHMVGE